ncbi:hypothetical protein JZU71_02290, partial [bacterium]|nr:hypothetical protein [bacterium]
VQIQGAQYAAFQYLIAETKRWSDIVAIKLNDGSQAEIAITFISPELIQAVFLSDILKDRFITSGFQTQIQNALGEIAVRDELLFLATVTSAAIMTIISISPSTHPPKRCLVILPIRLCVYRQKINANRR